MELHTHTRRANVPSLLPSPHATPVERGSPVGGTRSGGLAGGRGGRGCGASTMGNKPLEPPNNDDGADGGATANGAPGAATNGAPDAATNGAPDAAANATANATNAAPDIPTETLADTTRPELSPQGLKLNFMANVPGLELEQVLAKLTDKQRAVFRDELQPKFELAYDALPAKYKPEGGGEEKPFANLSRARALRGRSTDAPRATGSCSCGTCRATSTTRTRPCAG